MKSLIGRVSVFSLCTSHSDQVTALKPVYKAGRTVKCRRGLLERLLFQGNTVKILMPFSAMFFSGPFSPNYC